MELFNKIRNLRWLLTISLAYLSHKNVFVYQGENEFIEFIPSWGSTFFVLGMALAVAELRVWPSTLRTPPKFLLTIYEVRLNPILHYSQRNKRFLRNIASYSFLVSRLCFSPGRAWRHQSTFLRSLAVPEHFL